MPLLGGWTGLRSRDKDLGPSFNALRPDQSIGIAIGIVAILSLLLLFCCYLKCGACCFPSRTVRRRTKQASEKGQASSHEDPEMQRHGSEAQNIRQPQHTANGTLPRTSSIASSSQLYVDSKIELPVPDGMRHEIDGVGRSAATAPNKVEIDGTPVGPFELPSEPVAPRQSWRTSSTTLFHYSPRPSYILSEEDEHLDGKDPDATSPKTPADYQRLEIGAANRSSGLITPLTPAAPRPVASLSGVVETQADERDTTKEVLSPQEEDNMLKRNSWNVWRNWGGGAGGAGSL